MTKEELERENAELQEKISVLLSCKNCPENKGGWGCEKEYENKCLKQKIVYIKELKEENCELLGIIQGKDEVIHELKKENAELKNRNSELASQKASLERWYGEAKEIIKKFSEFVNNDVEFDPEHPQEHTDLWNELCEKAEQFISEVEK